MIIFRTRIIRDTSGAIVDTIELDPIDTDAPRVVSAIEIDDTIEIVASEERKP